MPAVPRLVIMGSWLDAVMDELGRGTHDTGGHLVQTQPATHLYPYPGLLALRGGIHLGPGDIMHLVLVHLRFNCCTPALQVRHGSPPARELAH
jgi:hypothetical protein